MSYLTHGTRRRRPLPSGLLLLAALLLMLVATVYALVSLL